MHLLAQTYDFVTLVSEFCSKNDIFLVVDAISSFLANPLNMVEDNIDVFITGSQKALACPPGISIIVLGDKALERVENNECKCMYFDLKDMLINGVRGQTPFTPAVRVIIELEEIVKRFEEKGIEYDAKRDEYLKSLGLTILRYSNYDVNTNFYGVCTDIRRKLLNHD